MSDSFVDPEIIHKKRCEESFFLFARLGEMGVRDNFSINFKKIKFFRGVKVQLTPSSLAHEIGFLDQ